MSLRGHVSERVRVFSVERERHTHTHTLSFHPKVSFEGRNVHTVCSLLKLYCRELPEPLLTHQLCSFLSLPLPHTHPLSHTHSLLFISLPYTLIFFLLFLSCLPSHTQILSLHLSRGTLHSCQSEGELVVDRHMHICTHTHTHTHPLSPTPPHTHTL